jgi:hypothetical protein
MVSSTPGRLPPAPAGRNEGIVVCGRYYYYVHETVLRYLHCREDLDSSQRDALAHEFAEAYM